MPEAKRKEKAVGRLIATIKYGSAKTRFFLLAVFVLVAGGLALAIYGGITYELWALAVGALAMIVGLMMVFLANFVSQDVDDDDEEDEDERPRGSKTGNGRRSSMTEETDEDGDDGYDDDGEDRPKRIRHKKEEVGGDSKIVSIEFDEEEELPDDDGDEDDESGSGFFSFFRRRRRRKSRRAKAGRDELDIRPARSFDEDGGDEAAGTPGNRESRAERDARAAKEARIDRMLRDENEQMALYTPILYRQLLHRYKVKKDFVPVIIDDSKKFDTARTPALVWMKKKIVYFLLMEGNERVESMPLSQFLNVTYRSEVKEENLDAYNRIRNDMGIYEQFEDVMPTFNSFTNRMGITNYTKNQYVLGGIVAVTPRSMRALRAKYKFDMHIYDSLKLEGEHSIYFKRAFEARLLWIDQVIGQQEYQNIIGAILQQMVDDTSMSRYDFLDNLEQMIQNRLITDEYADYYMQQRQRAGRGRR